MTSEVAKKEELAQARATASQIRQGIHTYLSTLALIARANKEQHWKVLGYESWQSYVDGEFGAERLKLPAEHRRKAVEELRLAGLSVRAIGSAVGVSTNTVLKDLSQSETPDEITGTDGKTYAASRPETPARRDPEQLPPEAPAVATTGGPAQDRPSATAEEAAGQPASPGPATGPREAEGVAPPEAADSSVEDSGDTSTDGEEGPDPQPDSSDAAGAPAHFPAAGAPDPDWKTAFLADVFALRRLTRHDVDVVADQADSECIAEMGRAFAEIAEYRTKVLAALKASLPPA